MYKNLYLFMDYLTFTKWQLFAVVSGAFLGWSTCKFLDAYQEAKEAGAIA